MGCGSGEGCNGKVVLGEYDCNLTIILSRLLQSVEEVG